MGDRREAATCQPHPNQCQVIGVCVRVCVGGVGGGGPVLLAPPGHSRRDISEMKGGGINSSSSGNSDRLLHTEALPLFLTPPSECVSSSFPVSWLGEQQ